jgi:hypothetical protein
MSIPRAWPVVSRFRRANKHQAMTAANVENLLVSPPQNRIDHFVTQANLSGLAAPDHDEALQNKTSTNPYPFPQSALQLQQLLGDGHRQGGQETPEGTLRRQFPHLHDSDQHGILRPETQMVKPGETHVAPKSKGVEAAIL